MASSVSNEEKKLLRQMMKDKFKQIKDTTPVVSEENKLADKEKKLIETHERLRTLPVFTTNVHEQDVFFNRINNVNNGEMHYLIDAMIRTAAGHAAAAAAAAAAAGPVVGASVRKRIFTFAISSHGISVEDYGIRSSVIIKYGGLQTIIPYTPHGKTVICPNILQTLICNNAHIKDYEEQVEKHSINPYIYDLRPGAVAVGDAGGARGGAGGVIGGAGGAVYTFPHDYILSADAAGARAFFGGLVLCNPGGTNIILHKITGKTILFSQMYELICAYVNSYCQGDWTGVELNIHLLFCRYSESLGGVVEYTAYYTQEERFIPKKIQNAGKTLNARKTRNTRKRRNARKTRTIINYR
jgi:hypothetical protein